MNAMMKDGEILMWKDKNDMMEKEEREILSSILMCRTCLAPY